jgi:hypothetical protein
MYSEFNGRQRQWLMLILMQLIALFALALLFCVVGFAGCFPPFFAASSHTSPTASGEGLRRLALRVRFHGVVWVHRDM